MESLKQQCGPRLYAVQSWFLNQGDEIGWRRYLGELLASGCARVSRRQAQLMGEFPAVKGPVFDESLPF